MRYLHFKLPDVGEGLTEADLVSWAVAPGDTVTANQLLCEIETAKSVVELPSPQAGVVRELLVSEGQTVDVGAPLLVIDTDPGSPEGPDDGAASGATAEPAPTAASGGTDAGEASEEDGESSGSVLVGYGTSGAASSRRKRKSTSPDEPAPATPPSKPAAVSAPEQEPAPRPSDARVLAKPPVRKLAKDLGVDLAAVSGTGPGGIITREDVHAHVGRTDAQSLATYPGEPWLEGGTVSPDGRTTRVAARAVRRRTAEAMVSSAFTAPHVTVFHTVDITRTMELVERLKSDKEFAGVRVTPLLVVMKAFLLAIRRHPEVNASWDSEREEIVYKHYVNLGIAAQTPRGLMVPNIKDAHRHSMLELAHALGDLVERARAGKTQPAEMSDGTVSITNVGVFGIDTGTPILNPGESVILAFGAVRPQPWVHHGEIAIRQVTQLALSMDHRLVDGALGSKMLADVARILEDPAQAFVWS
ncbi:dihydrolipoamide acetyltransferase family protein [Bogoriella caseilytica]|uniref:Dihydrolipoamide acetyltransferase component of pyruvate dehydrogenase complex n=1 Tax=Bogoriella caseilytica TaxID=56055 RepID=A0A3N2BBV0_9MICO|nr:dihydrolipoamide acetyltransferase family protein [Bogoriella caseilytica]ROR72708.1 pyruvate dehydrogenase E2 component (dihydrolipoamide acetyltransferase) [Bogoriella caseilytica]